MQPLQPSPHCPIAGSGTLDLAIRRFERYLKTGSGRAFLPSGTLEASRREQDARRSEAGEFTRGPIALALWFIQRGIDGPLAEGGHCGIVARLSQIGQSQRERPATGAHPQCIRLLACPCLDPRANRSWQHPEKGEIRCRR